MADITEVSHEDPLDDDEEEEDISEKIVDEVIEALIEANDENNNSFNEEVNENEDEDEEGLMNVNVKERRQYLLDLLNDAKVLKTCTPGTEKSTMSRLAAKKAAVVRMAVQNLNNLNKKPASSPSVSESKSNQESKEETTSILEMEASNKVKFMVSKFEN